jgi:PAS domain S-box-containing protein
VDADFRLRTVNPLARAIFAGIPDVIGRDLDEVLHTLWPPARADGFVALVRRTLESGEPFSAPDVSEVRDDIGVAEYYAWQVNRVSLPEGGHGVACYVRDIAAEVRARHWTGESEILYRTLFASAPMAVLACDRRCTIQMGNALAVELLGREPTYGVEQCWSVQPLWLLDGTRMRHAQHPMETVLSTGVAVHNLQVSIERPDGSRLPVLMNIAAQKAADGAIIGTVTSLEDLSARLRGELALNAAQRKLEFVMDAMPQKIWTATPDSQIGYLNSQWLEYTGLEFDQIRDWSRTGFIHADDLTHTFANWNRGFASGQPIQIEHRFQRWDGEYRWHISRCLPLRNLDGEIELWVGSSTDIHDQKLTANELQESAIALVAADSRKDEFLAMLAHELRNPLAPVNNALRIMQLSDSDAPTIERARQMIERQTIHMTRLVDDLLDVSRIRRGTIELRRERVDLLPLLRQAVETHAPAIEAAQHELILSLPTEPLYLDADPVRMVQMLGNLLNNAVKYTPTAGRIRLAVVREQDEVVITVRDSGVGIPVDMLERVFDMFGQVDQSLERAAGGLGVGLSLVHRIVLLHGGVVTACSDGAGRGSEFVVRLPAATTTPATTPHPDGTRTRAAAARRRVLIVDDNRDSADSLTLYLQMIGHEVRAVYDGHEAVAAAATFRPELILLDIGLPNLNGYDAARRIRENEWGQSMALVALSGWGQQEAKRLSIEAGMNAHLVKPVDHTVLAQLMSELPTTSP